MRLYSKLKVALANIPKVPGMSQEAGFNKGSRSPEAGRPETCREPNW